MLVHASILVLTSVVGAVALLRLGWTSSVHEVGEVVEEVIGGPSDADADVDAVS